MSSGTASSSRSTIPRRRDGNRRRPALAASVGRPVVAGAVVGGLVEPRSTPGDPRLARTTADPMRAFCRAAFHHQRPVAARVPGDGGHRPPRRRARTRGLARGAARHALWLGVVVADVADATAGRAASGAHTPRGGARWALRLHAMRCARRGSARSHALGGTRGSDRARCGLRAGERDAAPARRGALVRRARAADVAVLAHGARWLASATWLRRAPTPTPFPPCGHID